MAAVAIIGGSGLAQLDEFHIERRQPVDTPFGETSAAPAQGHFNGIEVIFIHAMVTLTPSPRIRSTTAPTSGH